MEEARNHPTMIIPSGTEITVNDQGQLSIRTPGNLVIQNSGIYSVIESTKGSIRIDPDVRVDAVTISAAESCFVAGELTAWKVKAARIILEKSAKAFIMLQESDDLQLDRSARLVGNFTSDKELYSTLARFNNQLQHLSRGLAASKTPALEAALSGLPTMEPDVAPVINEIPGGASVAPAVSTPAPTPVPAATPHAASVDSDSQRRSRMVFDLTLGRGDLSPEQRSALVELRDLATAGRREDLSLRAAAYTARLNSLGDDLRGVLSDLASG